MASTPTTPESDRPAPGSSVDFGMIAVTLIAAMGLVFSFVAFALDDDGGGEAAVSADGGAVPVELTEFAITPEAITVGAGGTLAVTNTGGQIHNLAARDTDLTTPDLANGESAVLDVSALDRGEYEVWCTIPGHGEAGMTGSLFVEAGGDLAAAPGGTGSDAGSGDEYEAIDHAMHDTMMQFPAETEGTGNVPLEPEILSDGTKRFELTASIVEWEVEPGKFVDAWAYNGMVPGPWIKVEVGDEVQVRVQNDLPMGTDVHWHGIKVPNSMDGVAPYTQDIIEPGDDFVYEFTAREKAVGMYHAHHAGQIQVPNGLLGVFQIGDVDLPRGRTISGTTIPADLEVAQEIQMVLNDAGAIGLSLNGKSFPATEPYTAESGDWLLVHYHNEGMQSHPMHQHQFPQLVVAKDGIPLDNPYFADTVNVAPGERYSVLINPDEAGTWVWHCHILNHVERDAGMFGMVTALIVT